MKDLPEVGLQQHWELWGSQPSHLGDGYKHLCNPRLSKGLTMKNGCARKGYGMKIKPMKNCTSGTNASKGSVLGCYQKSNRAHFYNSYYPGKTGFGMGKRPLGR